MIGAGAVVAVFGLLFLLQGSGVVGGSVMTNDHFWIYAGAVIAVVGLAVMALGFRRART